MFQDRIGLSDEELSSLAVASGRSVEDLGSELARRPWAVHDILSDPDTVCAVLEPDSLADTASPFLFFAVLTRLAADDLLASTYVNDWVGPRSRLPVFDVEPLQEFVYAPGRVLFVARLLASMVEPISLPLPIAATDPWELIDWLDSVDEPERVILLRRLGDLSLFLAGVHADSLGDDVLDPIRAEKVGRSLGMTTGEILAMIDPDSTSPGLDTLECLGACWYQESRRMASTIPPIVGDIAERIHTARRFLTHLTDRHLSPLESHWSIAS